MSELIEVRNRLLRELSAAQSQRRTRQDWIDFERRVMLDRVNMHRLSIGKVAVSMNDIVSVERMAVGHTDYSEKFALYCAELATGVRE